MPRTASQKAYNTFVKGLITEASALTFPENASVDEDNCILRKDGSRWRRFGMDYENDYALVDTGYYDYSYRDAGVAVYRWDNAGGNSEVSIGVIQVGHQLWFIDLYKEAASANLLNGGAALSIPGTGGIDRWEFATINGYCVITTGNTSPQVLSYDVTTDTVTREFVDVKIRDLYGIDDTFAVDYRPSSSDSTINLDRHVYNLVNQGWRLSAIQAYFDEYGVYPSNALIEYLGKGADGTYSTTLVNTQYSGTTQAPRGKNIISAWNRGQSRSGKVPSGYDIPEDSESGRPSCICAQAGRIFYSGIKSSVTDGDDNSPNYNGIVLFSQIIESQNQFGKCYQDADPSSETISDLVDTDGGTILIPEANNIFKLVAVQDSVIVVAETGIWQISGGDIGFRATEFQVNKITDIGASNAAAIVNAEGIVYYWSKGGIYRLVVDQISAKYKAENVSETTIQSFFDDIPSVGRGHAIGSYDTANKTIRWMYNDSSSYDGSNYRYQYTKELVFDTILQAFYPSSLASLDENSPYIAGYISTPNFLSADYQHYVTVDGEQVTVDGEDVIVTQSVRARGISRTKYLTIRKNASDNKYYFTLSYYKDINFRDWYTADTTGAYYDSYMVAGYELFGDIMRDKQVDYLMCYFNRTESGFDGSSNALTPSSCKVQAQWEWTDSATSGRWGAEFQAYRILRPYIVSGVSDSYDNGFPVVVTKNKIRGKGKALSLKFTSEDGKDFQLLGWAVSASGNTIV